MALLVTARVERFDVAGAFTISRGAKTHVDVVVCEVRADGVTGRGEGTPIYYRGETAAGCIAQIRRWARAGAHADRARLLAELPPGAARNALDCALWDLEARQLDVPLHVLAGLARPEPVATALTISLAAPPDMERAAAGAAARGFVLLKAKLAGDGDDPARVAAIRRGAPLARIVVDANEGWLGRDVAAGAAELAAQGVELLEQPLPPGDDAALAGLDCAIPLCADESCHTAADLPRIAGRYRAINVKLDKAGGLTAALELARAAQAQGLDLMLGCMLSTSLAIRPALALAGLARWVDLDGPALLAKDRDGGLRYSGGMIWPD
ncbi:dipeptide epimerase [Novosphingobium lentum]|uniref:dipeptide epimerase n=1 Tax=Novosphingobium lentum TaxID=145287 RepID=UPI00082A5497|nr:dipeptide epimerase [Novosphingobium lentum]